MGTPTLSSHPKGTHAKLGETDDAQLHYPKGFVSADDNTMIVKGDDSEIAYTGAIYSEKITVTSAEILAISTTPVTLFASLGLSKRTRILAVTTYCGGTTNYTASDNLLIQSDGDTIVTIDTTALTSNKFVTASNPTEYFYCLDKEIVLTSVSNPTGGDGDLTLFITYQILEV